MFPDEVKAVGHRGRGLLSRGGRWDSSPRPRCPMTPDKVYYLHGWKLDMEKERDVGGFTRFLYIFYFVVSVLTVGILAASWF